MFMKKATMNYTGDCLQAIERLKQEIQRADAILVGAGAGLSTAAGLTYTGERFQRNFSDFIQQYSVRDMYSATFYPYDSPEEYWAYMSRHILLNRYTLGGGGVYANLLALVQNRDYFVLTTNVDHCFQKSGFDKRRLFYTQGDYGLWQCGKPCHPKTYDNQEIVQQMVTRQSALQVPSDLIPYCPKCGKPMSMNLRCDGTFVEDEGWHQAMERYRVFLKTHQYQHVLFLELGVGMNTPGIIKYPFWQMTYQNNSAVYACVNLEDATAPMEIEDRSICIQGDLEQVLAAL